MSVNKQGAQISRRGFLKGAAMVSGAAAATALTAVATAGPEASTEVPKQDEGSQGYHVTPHILEYYEKARF